MVSDSSSDTRRGFLAIARNLNYLSDEAAREITDEAATKNIPASQLALQKGLLSAIQIDIVDTLSRPMEVIPGYEILDALGQGGMGVVYRARQQNLKRIVALKTVLVSQMSDPNMLARFEQEAMTVAKLRHPNIVGAYDFGRHEGRLYFAMEFVEGEDADSLITRVGRVDEATAWGLARQAAAGLSHAAHSNIVHRDIKPANLLLVEPPEGFSLPAGLPMVKIADFGLAFLTSGAETRTRLTSTNAAVGSPHYMSPEQYNSDTVDFHADVYSLGATVYHMLTGVPPFHGLSLPRIVTAKIRGETPDPIDKHVEVSDESKQLVARLMHHEPRQRVAEYTELIRRIDDVLVSVGSSPHAIHATNLASTLIINKKTYATSAGPDPTVELTKVDTKRVAKRTASRRVLAIAALFVVLVVGAISAFLMFGPKQYVPGPADLVPTGNSHPLYTGRDLKDWPVSPISGSWGITKDTLGARGIAGTNGVHRRSLPDWPNYRLTVFVWLRDAKAAEIHFGIADGTSANHSRSVVRITKEGLQIGRRPSDDGPWQAFGPLRPFDIRTDDFSAVHIEKQSSDWFVFFGNELVGALPVGAQLFLNEFRLRAEDGTAWFHQIEISELLPKGNGSLGMSRGE